MYDPDNKFTPTKATKMATERKFGIMFTAIFLVAGSYWYINNDAVAFASMATLSVALIIITITAPKKFSYPLHLWIQFGKILHQLMSPLFLFLMYFGLVFPFALAARTFGYDPFRIRSRKHHTMWVCTHENIIGKDYFERQF